MRRLSDTVPLHVITPELRGSRTIRGRAATAVPLFARLRAALLSASLVAALTCAPTVVAAQEAGGRRVTATALLVAQDGVNSAQMTSVGVGVRRGIEADSRLRFADPVDLLSNASVPDEIQAAIDDLDPIAELVRSGDAADGQRRAQAAIQAFEMALVAVKRTALTDAYMLEAVALCRLNQRRQCVDGFARVITFRESIEYDESRYPADYAALFAQTKQRVLAGPRGAVQIVTEPEGAEVFVDGRSFGAAPAVADGLLVGDHFVTIKRVGFEKLIARVTVEPDRTATARFPLQPIQRALLLERDLSRLPAELGEDRAGPVISGLTGYLFANQAVIGLLRPGEGGGIDVSLYLYDLRTRFLLKERRATVPDGEAIERITALVAELYDDVDLSGNVEAPPDEAPRVVDPARPLWEQWWFWTAIGVVLVSGIVVALTIDTDPEVPQGFTRFDGTVR